MTGTVNWWRRQTEPAGPRHRHRRRMEVAVIGEVAPPATVTTVVLGAGLIENAVGLDTAPL